MTMTAAVSRNRQRKGLFHEAAKDAKATKNIRYKEFLRALRALRAFVISGR